MNTEISQISHYEIYLQDLSYPYLELELLGVARTIQEAQTFVALFKEALMTADSRHVDSHRNLSKCTVVFRAVLVEAKK